MTYIEEYYQFLLREPDKACHKVLTTYKKLVQDIYNPKQVSFFNKITEENETHTYIYNEKRAVLPIEFDSIATCESSDSRFYCHDNRRQPRAMMRNQRRVATCGDRQSSQLVQPPMIMRAICIRGRRRHAYNCVKMIGHHYKKRDFHIRKMLVTSSQSLVQRFPGFR